MAEIKVLALDLDGTLTNSQKEVTPRTRAALDAAIAKGVTIVLASGRPTAGVLPLAKELGLDKKGGCILSYNGGKIIDCRTGETLYQKQLDAQYVPELCAFAAAQNVTIITYNKEGVVTEHPDDKWALRECFTCKLPMTGVDDLARYVDYPICKMLITLDPARRDEVWAAGKKQFDGRIDLYPSSPFFIEAVPLGVAKDGSLAALLEHMGLGRENLMACGDGLNDRSMIEYAGVGVAMQNAEEPVKAVADYVTAADNDHDGAQFGRLSKGSGIHRCNAELCHTLTGLDGIGLGAQIDHGHLQFPAVVTVHHAHAVCHAQAVLDGKAAAGIDQRHSVGAGQLDGKAGGHQCPLHGGQCQGLIQHGAQVGRRCPRRCIGGHLGPGVQYFIVYGDRFHSIPHKLLLNLSVKA